MSIGRDDFDLLLEKIEKSDKRSEEFESLQKDIRGKEFSSSQLQELYLAAIPKHPIFLTDVNRFPLEVKCNLAIELVKKNKDYLSIVKSTSEKNPTQNELNIFLPEKMYKQVCLSAIKSDVEAFRHIPNEMLDFELLLVGVRESGRVLSVVSDYKNIPLTEKEYKELCLEAVKKTPRAIENVNLPDDQKKEFALIAVNEDFHAIIYVPATLLEHEDFKEAIQKWRAEALKDWVHIQNVQERLLTKEICDAAVRSDLNALFNISKKIQNRQLI